jgi:hypothetical protein
MTKVGPRVTKQLENLLDQHGLLGAIEAVTDAPFTRERQIALLAQVRADHKKSRDRTKAAQRHQREQQHQREHPPVKIDWTRHNEEAKREAKLRAEEREREDKLRTGIIREGRNAMAKKLHPDVGGSTEDMARLNREAGRLRGYGR